MRAYSGNLCTKFHKFQSSRLSGSNLTEGGGGGTKKPSAFTDKRGNQEKFSSLQWKFSWQVLISKFVNLKFMF